MKQEINPAVAAVIVVVVLIVIGLVGFSLMGKKHTSANEAENDPRYKAAHQAGAPARTGSNQ